MTPSLQEKDNQDHKRSLTRNPREGKTVSQKLTKKNYQPRVLHPTKHFLKCPSEINKKSRQAQMKENYQHQAHRTRILKEKISKEVPKNINKEEGGLEKNGSVVVKCTDCSSRGP